MKVENIKTNNGVRRGVFSLLNSVFPESLETHVVSGTRGLGF